MWCILNMDFLRWTWIADSAHLVCIELKPHSHSVLAELEIFLIQCVEQRQTQSPLTGVTLITMWCQRGSKWGGGAGSRVVYNS